MLKNARPYRVSSGDFQSVSQYFESLGFKVLSFFDTREGKRHNLFGSLLKDGKRFFLKIVQEPQYNNKPYNEVLWSNHLNQILKKEKVDYLNVPTVIQTGLIEGNFYLVTPFHTGNVVASQAPPESLSLEKWIDTIIKINLFFIQLKSFYLVRDTEKPNPLDSFLKDTYQRHEQVSARYRLSEIFQKMTEVDVKQLPCSINHGDFVPWHMIKRQGGLVLVDGEYASTTMPRYYDVIYCFQRIYTHAENPAVARSYIRQFRARLPLREQRTFNRAFQFILGSRIISSFWHIERLAKKDHRYELALKKEYLANAIF